MSLTTTELLNVIADLAKIKEMKLAVNVSTQCGLVAGISTIIGGLIGGPVGVVFGGVLGSGIAGYHAKGKFKSVPEILATEVTNEQREKLASALRKMLTIENIFTVTELLTTIESNNILMEALQKIVRDFFASELGYTIQ